MIQAFLHLRLRRLRERWAYVRLRFGSGLRRHRTRHQALPRAVRTVLFVCQGNIIRSPFAATLLPTILDSALRSQIRTDSAGVETTPGKPADSRAIRLAADFGISLDLHRTKRLDSTLVEWADLIVAMDTLNVAKCLVRFPEAKHKLRMLGSFCDPADGLPLDIRDPYSGSLEDVRQCYQTIALRLSRLAELLASHHRTRTPVETTPR